MTIEVTIPGLLADCARGETCFAIEADTLTEALHRLREEYPLLRIHLYDESERLRPHIVLFYNEESIAWLERLDVPLRPGDRLYVLQAVSGG